jgi:hypothetical protein
VLLETGSGTLPEEMIAAIICEKFGWTYEEYLDQPHWFIEIIKTKLREDAEFEKKEMAKAKFTERGSA